MTGKRREAAAKRAPWLPDQAAREAQRLDAGHGVLAPAMEAPAPAANGKVHYGAVLLVIVLALVVVGVLVAATWYAVTHVALTAAAVAALWAILYIVSKFFR
jgi:hypothetical protein